MDSIEAIAALSALAQATRLDTFRLLFKREPDGVSAGELARLMEVPKSRSIIYRADLSRFREVTLFLLKDCCGGVPTSARRSSPISLRAARALLEPMADRTFNILFLCTGNSARSIMAESILCKLGAGRFNAFSAGSHPKGAVNPFTLKTLETHGFPTEGLRSKSWDEFAAPDAPHMDFVFTVCDNAAGEACSFWPRQPMTAHWGIEDPAAVEGTAIDKERAFNQAFRFLRNRIVAFTSLPFKSLDTMALTARLREISEMDGTTRVVLMKAKEPHHR